MDNSKNPVVLCEEDYQKLKQLIGTPNVSEATPEMSLAHEIGRAIVVKDSAFPSNTIRINSTVRVLDVQSGRENQFQIVMPGEADMKQKKISVLTQMSAALIGFREGDEVVWKMPAGLKTLKVLEVRNEAALQRQGK